MMSHPEVVHSRTVAGCSLACVLHDEGGPSVVLFCHGFRGERTGPNRTFVTTARRLAARGISSLHFDQLGSGDSAGDFLDSSFTDWVRTIRVRTEEQLAQGRRSALLGQSMGASAALCAAPALPVAAVVAWVPDASIDVFTPDARGFVEEGGQRVRNGFWQEAHGADVPGRLRETTAPCSLVFGAEDEYVSTENREALIDAASPADRVDVLEGYPHSA